MNTTELISGIYCITFPSGEFYIGRSVDIHARWQQHADKLAKGKGARPMQRQYDEYGSFNARVVQYCHVDHIDLLEAYYINVMQPSLNTSIPANPFESYSEDLIDCMLDWFQYSTESHVTTASDLTSKVQSLEVEVAELNTALAVAYAEIDTLTNDLDEVTGVRSKTEEADAARRILQLRCEQLSLEAQNVRLAAEVKEKEAFLAYKKKPLWRRVLSYLYRG